MHDEGGVHEEFVSATTTTRLSEACMGTAGAADTTTATLVGTMGMLDGSTAQSHTATSPGLGKPSSLEPGQVGGGSNVGILPVVGSMDSIGSGGCSKCEGEL